jgi:hypothetical protein
MYTLSKSTFLRGAQCLKSLFLNKFHKELRDKNSISLEALYEQGNDVGILARNLFAGGIEVVSKSAFNYQAALLRTKEILSDIKFTAYEATFVFEEIIVANDILVKEGAEYYCYEVKSSTEIKDVFIWDCALQYYILKNNGINIKDFFIIYVNNQYVRGETLLIDQLFARKSILDKVIERQPYIADKIQQLKSVLNKKECPPIDIGMQCHDPYPCDFISQCWKNIPETSVFEIANLKASKKFELYYQGIIELKDIPKDYPLNENQWQQIEAELNQATIILKPEITAFISGMKYPMGFLDFETFQLAIPAFKNSRAYQQIVFQYSLHKLNSKMSAVEHVDFIANESNDPRIQFIEKLIVDCNGLKDILVYNIGFEKSRLSELALDFPQYSDDISKIIERLKDLMLPFKERWYYSHDMRGSYSIKKVLPSLIPDFNYNDLEIKDGLTASSIFSSMVTGNFKGDEEKAKTALLEYCKLDTLAMVKILNKLNDIAESK